MGKVLFTLQEVAETLRMKWSWVDKMVRQGEIKAVKMGKNRMVNKKELDRLVKEGVE